MQNGDRHLVGRPQDCAGAGIGACGRGRSHQEVRRAGGRYRRDLHGSDPHGVAGLAAGQAGRHQAGSPLQEQCRLGEPELRLRHACPGDRGPQHHAGQDRHRAGGRGGEHDQRAVSHAQDQGQEGDRSGRPQRPPLLRRLDRRADPRTHGCLGREHRRPLRHHP